MGPTWVLSAPDRPHVGPMNLVIRVLCVRNPAVTDGFSTQWVIKAENVSMSRRPHYTLWYILALLVLCYSLFLYTIVGRFYPHSSGLLHLHCSGIRYLRIGVITLIKTKRNETERNHYQQVLSNILCNVSPGTILHVSTLLLVIKNSQLHLSTESPSGILTHWGRNTRAATLQTFPKPFFWKTNWVLWLILISVNFVDRGSSRP